MEAAAMIKESSYNPDQANLIEENNSNNHDEIYVKLSG